MQAPVANLAGLFCGAPAQPGLCPGAGRRAERPRPAAHSRLHRSTDHHDTDKETTMAAALSQDDLLEAIDKMTVLELSEFIKKFEERYGVTAAAPAAAAAAPAAAGGGDAAAAAPRGADRVHRDPDRDRPEQDPGHQGRPRADRPRPQGGQGRRRRRAQGRQGRRRPRTRPRRSRLPSKSRAARSRSSSHRPDRPGGRCRLRALAHAPSSALAIVLARRLRLDAGPAATGRPERTGADLVGVTGPSTSWLDTRNWPHYHVEGRLTRRRIAISYSFCERGPLSLPSLRQGVVLHAVRR